MLAKEKRREFFPRIVKPRLKCDIVCALSLWRSFLYILYISQNGIKNKMLVFSSEWEFYFNNKTWYLSSVNRRSIVRKCHFAMNYAWAAIVISGRRWFDKLHGDILIICSSRGSQSLSWKKVSRQTREGFLSKLRVWKNRKDVL